MNMLLTRLGVPPEIQAFFKASGELRFNYGDAEEHFGETFHKVPATTHLWVAGSDTASKVVITYSAMEAIALITVKRHAYPRLDHLAFIAVGNRLHQQQAEWIRQNFKGRRFVLAFGKDLIGRITDIKLAAALQGIPVRIFHEHHQVLVFRREHLRIFEQERLSLHQFQDAFGIRPRIPTCKPVRCDTFLDQLRLNSTCI